MALSHARVVAIGETLYPHEQEGINFAIQALPDTDPYHLWALIDLLDKSTGRYVEIDLLILGYSCLSSSSSRPGPAASRATRSTGRGPRPRAARNGRRTRCA